MLHFLVICLTLVLVLSCASAPDSYPSLDESLSNLEIYKQDPKFQESASITIFQVEEYIQQASLEVQENNLATADHLLYLANTKLEIAKELSLKHENEQELIKLEQQYNEMLAHSSRLESKRVHDEKLKAEERIEKLETMLGKYQAEETSRGTLLVINDLLFDTGGVNLIPESENRLEPLVQYLQGNAKKEIIVEGHTDSMGNASQNKHLSLQRANAVKQYLQSRGINATRIETRGFGEEVPVSSNTTKAGRKLNRRVEIVIKPTNHVEF